MKIILYLAAVAALYCVVDAKQTAPKVQVYGRDPGEFGKENTLICHVSNFYPPGITIVLLKDGADLLGAQQTDLAFNQDWHFHLTKSVPFTPVDGQKYSCKVTHAGTTKYYAWEPNM